MNDTSDNSRDQRERTREFVRLLARHERPLFAYILALVPNWADADEIAQETKIRLWEQFAEFEPGSQFGAWARKVAHYKILTYRRQQQRESVRFSAETVELLAAAAESRADTTSSRHFALERCLSRLSDSQRELVVQCYAQQEQSVRDAARQLGRTYEATRRSLFRIRKRLAECVDRTLQTEGL